MTEVLDPQVEAMMEVARPKPEHLWLQKLVGEWTYESEGTMEPGGQVHRHTGSERVRAIGEIWILGEGECPNMDGSPGTTLLTLGYDPAKERWLTGIEAVIDKDLASELLAEELEADLFVIATDVDGVYLDWGKPEQRILSRLTPKEARAYNFPAGSMGPKVEAAIQFVEKTGKRATIGSLEDIEQIVAGTAGTSVVPA